MTTQERLTNLYGDPKVDGATFASNHLTIWDVGVEFPWVCEEVDGKPRITVFGKPFRRISCHKLIVDPLRRVFKKLYETGLYKELKTFDGCYNVRFIRGYEKQGILSIHSWALAVDFNASENGLGQPVKFSQAFLQIWRDEGWTCGADFPRLDGMHFEYTKTGL